MSHESCWRGPPRTEAIGYAQRRENSGRCPSITGPLAGTWICSYNEPQAGVSPPTKMCLQLLSIYFCLVSASDR
jgi:hypothetical protein